MPFPFRRSQTFRNVIHTSVQLFEQLSQPVLRSPIVSSFSLNVKTVPLDVPLVVRSVVIDRGVPFTIFLFEMTCDLFQTTTILSVCPVCFRGCFFIVTNTNTIVFPGSPARIQRNNKIVFLTAHQVCESRFRNLETSLYAYRLQPSFLVCYIPLRPLIPEFTAGRMDMF